MWSTDGLTGMGMGMNFMGMGWDGVKADGDEVGTGKFLWGWGGDGADVHYRITL